jgi:hypothetical protein
MHGKMGYGNASGLKFAPASVIGAETAGVRLEPGTVQRFCDLPQLPLAAASFECASHQQDGPRHGNFYISTRNLNWQVSRLVPRLSCDTDDGNSDA